MDVSASQLRCLCYCHVLVLPREGHLKQPFHMFAYLEKQHTSEMVFDHTKPAIDYSKFSNKI